MKVFRIKGTIGGQSFCVDRVGKGVDLVKERLYCELGSRHRVKRHAIDVSSVEEIKPSDSKSLPIRQMFEE